MLIICPKCTSVILATVYILPFTFGETVCDVTQQSSAFVAITGHFNQGISFSATLPMFQQLLSGSYKENFDLRYENVKESHISKDLPLGNQIKSYDSLLRV